MKAILSHQQELASYDYIYLTLLVDVLEEKQKKGQINEKYIFQVLHELAKVKRFLKTQKITIHPMKIDPDHEFIQFDITCLKPGGGLTEGNFRFWRHAIKMTLNKKMKSLQKGEAITESDLA